VGVGVGVPPPPPPPPPPPQAARLSATKLDNSKRPCTLLRMIMMIPKLLLVSTV
jgi:hypothetical protein